MKQNTLFLFALVTTSFSAGAPQTDTAETFSDLRTLPTFGARAAAYERIDKQLKNRGLDLGFFGAASSVCSMFSLNLLSRDSASAVNDLSRELTRINASIAEELWRTGRWNGMAIASEIDSAIVRREQDAAEAFLDRMPAASRNRLIGELNATLKASLLSQNLIDGANTLRGVRPPFPSWGSLKASQMVRQWYRIEATAPNFELDYGDVRQRVRIGETSAFLYRRHDATFTHVGAPLSLGLPASGEIQVRSGDVVEIEALGSVNMGGGHRSPTPAGVAFDGLLAPPFGKDHFGGLFAVLNGQSVFVGPRCTLTVRSSGSLKLVVNDRFTGDNSGGYLVGARVVRKSGGA